MKKHVTATALTLTALPALTTQALSSDLEADSIALVQSQSPTQLFTSLCVGEDAVGFGFNEGQWQTTHFLPLKYIIKKVSAEDPDNFRCRIYLEEAAPLTPHSKTLGDHLACYNVRTHGTELDDLETQLCTENWIKTEYKHVLSYVSCPGRGFISPVLNFKPNGAFHGGIIHSMLYEWTPDKNNKEPMYVTVGECSVIDGEPHIKSQP